jgi:VWFA-related protein
MKSKWIVFIATLLALLASIPLYALFQKDDFQISTSVFMVLLDVSVKDSRGGYVSNLTKDDFRIEENGVPQKIASFNSGDIPVTAGLVLDDSGSMRNKRDDVNQAGVDFVKASNRQDQLFVVNFNDKVRMGLPAAVDFSDDVEVLRAALAHDKPAGRTALYDAIALSLQHLDQGQQSKKTLVVVSDGGDNISTVSQAKAIQLIEESHATVYTVGIYDLDDADRNPKVLERIAHISGGESFFPESPSDIERVFDKIARDIRNRYTIGYIPSTGGASKLRHIKVTAAAAGHGHLQIRTRTSYLAPDEFVTKAEK